VTAASVAFPSFVLVNGDSKLVTQADLARVAAACQRQMIEHYAPLWGAGAAVRAATPSDPPRPGERVGKALAALSVDGALGYHDELANGDVDFFFSPELDAEDGSDWSVTVSHEILEAQADPDLRLAAQDSTGTFWALEIADAVEADTYEIDGVKLSNFCTRQWYMPPADGSGPFDYLGLCKSPFEVRAGGYAQRFDPAQGWVQVGMQRAARRKMAALGRGARRRAGATAAGMR